MTASSTGILLRVECCAALQGRGRASSVALLFTRASRADNEKRAARARNAAAAKTPRQKPPRRRPARPKAKSSRASGLGPPLSRTSSPTTDRRRHHHHQPPRQRYFPSRLPCLLLLFFCIAAGVLWHFFFLACFFPCFPRLCIYCPAGRRGAAQPTKPLLLLRFLFSTTRGRRGGPRGAPRSLADVKVERRSEKRSVARGAGLWLLRTPRTIAAAGAFPTPPPLFAHTPRARPAHVRNATPPAAEKREVPGKFSSSRSLMSFVVGRQADWRRRDARDPLAAALRTKLRQRSSGVREDELTSGHAKTDAEAITP